MAASNRTPSLFAQRMKKAKESKIKNSQIGTSLCNNSVDIVDQRMFGDRSYMVSGPDANQIHGENVERLATMSAEEIIKERDKLLSEMDPKLVEFLKAKKKMRSSIKQEGTKTQPTDNLPENEVAMETESVIPSDVSEISNRWPQIGTVEKEKVEWMKELPKPALPQPDAPYNARFNFDGTLLPFDDEKLDVRKGLHHHGEEPERPGYTLQELIQLSRSSVLQQRIIALNTLANILEKANWYSKCLDKPILPLLLDAELFLLLRFSLDDASRPIVSSSLAALCNLLVNHSDEACIDSLLGCLGGIEQPRFYVQIDMKQNELAELKDPELLRLDVIRGALRTLILSRFRYILDKMTPESTEVVQILKCLIRIARHSCESAQAVVSCSGLLDSVRLLLDSRLQNYFYPDALKLMRIIACHSNSLACLILDNYKIMDPILQCLAGERSEGQPEALRLMLESFYLWKTLLSYGFATDYILSAVPIIMKLLCVHIDHTNMDSSVGDQEHAVALLSTTATALEVSFSSARTLIQPLMQAAIKWISQIVVINSPTRSMCKLAGASMNLISIVSTKEKINTGVEAKLQKYLLSSLYTEALINLRKHSWLLSDVDKGTSPDNLPNLGSIPSNLKQECTQPFIEGIAAYIMMSRNMQLSELFLKNQEWDKYFQTFVSRGILTDVASHWYAKNEIRLISFVIIMSTECQIVDNNLFHHASLILATVIQNDDKELLDKIFDQIIFSLPFFREHMLALTMEVENLQIGEEKTGKSSSSLLLEAIDNLPEIKRCYILTLGLQPVQQTTPLSPSSLTASEKGCEPVLPSDWQFLPILQLHNSEGNCDNALNIAKSSLQWLLMLEHFHPDFSSVTPLAARFSRVCCLFLAGNDLFRDVTELLDEMLRILMSRKETLDLESFVPGLNNFYDFYRQLVDHFMSVSYGDYTFGQYILVPLQQCHSVRFRKLVWSEQAPLVRVLSTPIDKLVFPLDGFLEPCETDVQLLGTYLRFIAQGRVRPQWCPVLYKVAIHHVASFIKINPTHGFTKGLLQKIEALANKELRATLLNYPNQNGSKDT